MPWSADVRVPDGIEPITAYRVWRGDLFLRLHSLNNETQWEPGRWASAYCPRSRHTAPDEDCTCGLYAAKDIDLALVLAAGVLTSTSPGDSMPATAIVGKVELAGKVIEHDRGYRAERARVVEILPIEGRSRLTESLAERFGVPVGDQIPDGEHRADHVPQLPAPPSLVPPVDRDRRSRPGASRCAARLAHRGTHPPAGGAGSTGSPIHLLSERR